MTDFDRTQGDAVTPKTPRSEQLAAIAADLFARRGYHAVSVQDIAAVAGLSGPAIYRHFRGKQAILARVLLGSLDGLAAEAEEHLRDDPAAGPYTALAAATISYPEFGLLWRRERRHLAPEDSARAAERVADLKEMLAEAVRAARPELSASDTDLLAWGGLSVYGSVAEHRVRLPRSQFEALLATMAAEVASTSLPAVTSGPPAPPVTPSLATRREQLLVIAARMFRDRGFHAVTMEDIGAAAGIAGPSIYTHFSGKTELLETAADRIGERLRAETEEIRAAGTPPAETLERLEARFAATVVGYRDLFGAYFAEGHNLPDRARAESRRLQRALVDYWSQVVGEVSPRMPSNVARIRVHAAFAVANDLAQTRKLSGRPDLGADLRALMGTLLRGGAPSRDH